MPAGQGNGTGSLSSRGQRLMGSGHCAGTDAGEWASQGKVNARAAALGRRGGSHQQLSGSESMRSENLAPPSLPAGLPVRHGPAPEPEPEPWSWDGEWQSNEPTCRNGCFPPETETWPVTPLAQAKKKR
ncbi:unnamed protein product [Clonostachys byssicola]|uniref:Uncharacterized protein n=1 Tax=Clonostachys byssicola TaxID=160290 RepID=A0A9N9URI4_9HYPO|nr:unnamed protein product [Clonostachys byssicola]